MLKVALLGEGGTMPLPHRYLSSLLLSCNGKMILMDCGEGTQIALKKLGWGLKAIDIICISHYHPDHIVGLNGLLSTIGNSDRTESITIIGPIGLKEIMKGLMVIVPYLPYELNLVEIPEEGLQDFRQGDYILNSIYVEHSTECVSYSVKVHRSRRFNPEKAKKLDIPVKLWSELQKGKFVNVNGKIINPEEVLGEERRGLKISYVTDTRPTEKLPEFICDSDLLVCEGMYGEDEYLEKALNNKHMLFSEAATLSKQSKSKELWLTHFSPSLLEPNLYVDNAKNIFKNTEIGHHLMNKEFKFK